MRDSAMTIRHDKRSCWRTAQWVLDKTMRGQGQQAWRTLWQHMKVNNGRNLRRMAVWGFVFGLGCPIGGELAGMLLLSVGAIDFTFLGWRVWYELIGAVTVLTCLGMVVGHLLDEIAAHNEQLESHVRERTEQLVQSEKLAAMGQLSAGIAHELRNPLSAINTAAYCLASALQGTGELSDEVKRYLTVIQRNVERAQRIITSVLEFARPSQAEAVTVDLNELVDTALDIIIKNAEKHRIAVQVEFQPLPLVRCRPDAIKQAVLNILLNAIQAMPDGGVLTVRTEHETPNGQVRIIIADTGVGIPTEHLQRIFDPFWTTKPPGEGTGLGLSVARTAIEADGGRILVESEKGKGSTFTIVLPVSDEQETRRRTQDEVTQSRR